MYVYIDNNGVFSRLAFDHTSPYAWETVVECDTVPTAGSIWTGAGFDAPQVNQGPIVSVIPAEISNWQAKKQLIIEGVYERVVEAISTMDADAQVDWNHAAVFRRDYPLILQMQALLGRTDAETDAYFVAASKLQ